MLIVEERKEAKLKENAAKISKKCQVREDTFWNIALANTFDD